MLLKNINQFKKIKIFKALISCFINFFRNIPLGYLDFLFLPFDPNLPLPKSALKKLG